MMKIVIGLSGGVDSGTSAYILKNQGHELFAVSMIVYDTEYSKKEIEYAKKLAKELNIEHRVIDKTKEFKNKILDRFVNEYKNGLTPNPCAICNREIKFDMLLSIMKELNYDHIATGHYANIVYENGRYAIKKSKNDKKDQSYLLYNLTQEQLSKTIFPIGNMDKNEIRNIAITFNKHLSEKKDSIDLCFVKDMDYKEFINRYEYGDDYKEKIAKGKLIIDDKKGVVKDLSGNIIGYHNGIMNFTIGQRKGLNIPTDSKKYVVRIDNTDNSIVIGEEKDLYNDKFFVKELNCQGIDEIKEGIDYNFDCKIRYRDKGVSCILRKADDKYLCILSNKNRAITSGQSAVFYKNDLTMCGGIIV